MYKLLYEFVQELLSQQRYKDAYNVCVLMNQIRKLEDEDGN